MKSVNFPYNTVSLAATFASRWHFGNILDIWERKILGPTSLWGWRAASYL